MKHLQLGWVESMTEDGEIYYFNVMTNESLWDLPAFLKVPSTQYQHCSRRYHGNASPLFTPSVFLLTPLTTALSDSPPSVACLRIVIAMVRCLLTR